MLLLSKFKSIILLLLLVTIASCKTQKPNLNKIKGERISITTDITKNPEIESFISPYRDRIERDLDSVLAYAADTYSKSDGVLNTAIGNFMADIILSECNPILKKRTGKTIDAVILNHGGIRAEIPKGSVNARTAFNVMPFENEVIIAGIKGSQVNNAVAYLVKSRRANPIAGMEIVVDADYKLVYAKINDEEIQVDKVYYIATSDYLYNKGDNMSFFQPSESFHTIDYKIRNVIIDYFKKVDTINPKRDQRFTIKQY